MASQSSSTFSNIANGRKSPVSSSSRISTGSSFEMIPPRVHADMSIPVGAPMSFSEISAEQALERVQELMKENHSLRGTCIMSLK